MAATRGPGFVGRTTERDVLDGLLARVRGGESEVLVIRGEAGIGKTALLRYAARQASGFRVAQLTGVEAEMELPFAGIHQLCAPMLDRLDALPAPQRDALSVALGLAAGEVPDRFLVGLAVLSLLSAVAEERPLLCLVEDAQWLDAASSQILGFVARRVRAESVAIVVAVREPADRRATSTACPSSASKGCPRTDARALLASVVTGRLDSRVRDRIVAETRGNPLALLELPAAHDRCRAGRRLRASRRRRASGAHRGPLPAARRRAARGDAATDAAGGRRAAGRRGAGLARGPEARHRDRRARARRGRGAAARSGRASGSAIRWCARRSTGRRRPAAGSACTRPSPR